MPVDRVIPVSRKFFEELETLLEPSERFCTDGQLPGCSIFFYTPNGKTLEFRYDPTKR